MPSNKAERTELSADFNEIAGLARHFPALGILTKRVASNILRNPSSGDRRLDRPMQGALAQMLPPDRARPWVPRMTFSGSIVKRSFDPFPSRTVNCFRPKSTSCTRSRNASSSRNPLPYSS
jgi:hypothetical protein